jgi:hypothetical protein
MGRNNLPGVAPEPNRASRARRQLGRASLSICNPSIESYFLALQGRDHLVLEQAGASPASCCASSHSICSMAPIPPVRQKRSKELSTSCQAVSRLGTLRRSSLDNVELMTQKEVLNFKPAPRLEQIGDKCSKQVDDRKHRIR